MARTRDSFLHPLLLLFLVLIVCTSGTLVSFPFDAKKDVGIRLTTEDVASLMARNKVSSSDIRASVEDHDLLLLDSFSNTDISFHLCFSLLEFKQLLRSKSSTFSLLKSKLMNLPRHLNISSIVVRSNEILEPLLLSTLQSIHYALSSFKLHQRVKVTPMFSLALLKNLCQNHVKNLEGLIKFLKKSGTYLVVEVPMDEEMRCEDCSDQSLVQSLISAHNILCDIDMLVVLKVQVSAVSKGVKLASFVNKVVESLKLDSQIKNRIHEVFVKISLNVDSKFREHRREEHIFRSSHRLLLDHKKEQSTATRATDRDLTTPITNPATTPSTPSGIVTVPSTDPVTVLPINPTIPSVTVPSTNPVTTPITFPGTNPSIPITVPSTLPPPLVPVTNPVTTPAGDNTPGLVPVSPSNSGQSWCVAKTGVSDAAIQIALDYACGIGGADCSAIQQAGSCYNPNTLHDHASYAFNSYYQKNPTPTSCDFGGTATLVNTNPILCTNSVTPPTVPATNPTTPATTPSTILPPPLVPVTTPDTVPPPPPNINPVTNPLPPPSGVVGGITPGIVPVSPGNGAQNWCVAKMDALDAALETAIDYACGIGGADCSAIQRTGSCYIPNTLHDHASYAFNSYYQKNPTPASCDFGGTATLVSVNPSSGTCTYPASSSSSPVFNTGAAPGDGNSTTVFGSSNPIGSNSSVTSGSPTSITKLFSPSCASTKLLALITTFFIT